MKRLGMGLALAALLTPAAITLHASGQRGALAILNEPCADNTDTYAWVSGLARQAVSDHGFQPAA